MTSDYARRRIRDNRLRPQQTDEEREEFFALRARVTHELERWHAENGEPARGLRWQRMPVHALGHADLVRLVAYLAARLDGESAGIDYDR